MTPRLQYAWARGEKMQKTMSIFLPLVREEAKAHLFGDYFQSYFLLSISLSSTIQIKYSTKELLTLLLYSTVSSTILLLHAGKLQGRPSPGDVQRPVRAWAEQVLGHGVGEGRAQSRDQGQTGLVVHQMSCLVNELTSNAQKQTHFYTSKKQRSESIKAHSAHIDGSHNSSAISGLVNNFCSVAVTEENQVLLNKLKESQSFMLAGVLGNQHVTLIRALPWQRSLPLMLPLQMQ